MSIINKVVSFSIELFHNFHVGAYMVFFLIVEGFTLVLNYLRLLHFKSVFNYLLLLHLKFTDRAKAV